MSTKENQNKCYINDEVTDVGTECEYVYEEKTTKKKELSSESDKPKHKKSEAGVYDELDYTLNPRNESARTDETAVNDIENKDSWFNQQKIVIISVIAIFLLAVLVAGSVFATQGKF